jgi:serine/threonine protein kinase
MASVYHAIDVHLHRPAALKVIDIEYPGRSDYSERFVREARAMASWRHPNIPQIYQAGVEDGFSFYAMEYIEGKDLEKLLSEFADRGEFLPLNDVLLIGRAVAAALDYAHQRGAVHRDVKPSNILISDDGRILLSDFGLVLELDKGSRGEIFGSPHYIAPEQARSSSLAVPQSDLYALGIVLYEMLVGKPPFDDPSPANLALQHLTLEPPSPRQLNPSLSEGIEQVLIKSLQKLPQDRYQTGKELMDDLERTGAWTERKPSVSSLQPPATLAELPRDWDDQPRSTMSRLEVPSALPAEVTTEPPVQESPPALSIKRLVLPAVLAGCLLLAVCAMTLVPGWLSGIQERFSNPGFDSTTPNVDALPPTTRTAGHSTVTAEASIAVASETLSAPIPTIEVGTPTVSLGFFQIALAIRKDDSVFLINQSTMDLPLRLISLGDGEGELFGEEWEVDLLKPGQCVAVWKKEGNPEAPRGIQCELIGEKVERSGPAKFWNSPFNVFVNDTLVGTCGTDGEVCELSFDNVP